jgi:hypothetical protein
LNKTRIFIAVVTVSCVISLGVFSYYEITTRPATTPYPFPSSTTCAESAHRIPPGIEKKEICDPKSFIEVQELEDGSALILCRCEDPLKCVDEKYRVTADKPK